MNPTALREETPFQPAAQATPQALFEASRANDAARVVEVLRQRVCVNTVGAGSCLALHEAARVGAADAVDALLRAGSERDARDARGRTPLILACSGLAAPANRRAALALIAAGAQVDQADPSGRTPLMLAILTGAVEVVEALLRAEASVRARDAMGDNALHHALGRRGSTGSSGRPASAAPMVAAVLAAADRACGLAGDPATLGSSALARALVEAEDAAGLTPLALAALRGDAESCAILLDAGAAANDPVGGLRNCPCPFAGRSARELARGPARKVFEMQDAVEEAHAWALRMKLPWSRRSLCESLAA
ncbi:ankyrin repeat protein [Paraburkholderia fungorum]|jgi:ankyrin repeat protein|uniref:ankyrin repeat domain-containing protein n=1 Tax=Paraburkholderia fungorum TaxID=134537 RepID=UPI000D052DC1|nr:ankyrin repeat domain-containing protein [Paraburkholderia fungorum]PRZ56482.1 ankyrin repeat protein [Paraburkholderia fungorum]